MRKGTTMCKMEREGEGGRLRTGGEYEGRRAVTWPKHTTTTTTSRSRGEEVYALLAYAPWLEGPALEDSSPIGQLLCCNAAIVPRADPQYPPVHHLRPPSPSSDSPSHGASAPKDPSITSSPLPWRLTHIPAGPTCEAAPSQSPGGTATSFIAEGSTLLLNLDRDIVTRAECIELLPTFGTNSCPLADPTKLAEGRNITGYRVPYNRDKVARAGTQVHCLRGRRTLWRGQVPYLRRTSGRINHPRDRTFLVCDQVPYLRVARADDQVPFPRGYPSLLRDQVPYLLSASSLLMYHQARIALFRDQVPYPGYEKPPRRRRGTSRIEPLSLVGDEPPHISHRAWNKLMHIMHGNTTSKEVEVQLLSLNVAGLMLSLKGGEIEASNSHKLKEIDAHVSLWHRPALIAFQECGGGWAEMQLLRDHLRAWGYDSCAEPGELSVSGHDKHRRGGVLLGWQMGEFRKEQGAKGFGDKGIEGNRCEALIRVASIEEAKNNMMYSEDTASRLLEYAGKRALAARLVRKRGPMVGKVRVHGVVYVPASASGAVRSAFIEEIGKAAERSNDEGLKG